MSLSQQNIDKLCMTGIYHCDPVLSWLESFRRSDPYHCINWTFKVMKDENSDDYYMCDTYWSGWEGLRVKLDDKNIDKFELLFDMNDVHKVSPTDFYDYDECDRWHTALDSAGYQYSKYFFVRNGAKKNKEILLARLNDELDDLERRVEMKKKEIKQVMAEE